MLTLWCLRIKYYGLRVENKRPSARVPSSSSEVGKKGSKYVEREPAVKPFFAHEWRQCQRRCYWCEGQSDMMDIQTCVQTENITSKIIS